MHDSGADGHCVLHMHHDKSLDACILLLYRVYGAQGGVNGPTQLRSTAQSPVLTSWIAPLDETKVHDSGADGHCVLHMHPGKSLDACILLLHCGYGAQGGVNRTTDRAGRAPTRPLCDTRPSGGWASFSFFWSGRAGGRRLKIHAGPGGWAVNFSIGRPWASPGFLRILPRAELRTPIPILMDLKAI